MSLVHESLISVLDRRFVSTYYNAFTNGIGADDAAMRFVKGAKGLDAVGGPRYGLIMTPEGEALVSFGYGRDQFAASLRQVQKSQPRFMWATEEEQAILAAAAKPGASGEAHLAAARLRSELLDYAGARAQIEATLGGEPSPELRARAQYLRGHLAAWDLDRQDAVGCREAFAAMGQIPKDLRDDVAVDLVSLDIRLRPARGFFTGWEFKPGTDLERHKARLTRWIRTMPGSNRIGEMYFYLGLVRFGLKDRAGADEIWAQHVRTYPEDRFAMLSRIHDSGYQFSPFKHGTAGPPGGVISSGDLVNDPERIRKLIEALEHGGAEVQSSSGQGKQQMIRMLKQMLARALERKKAEAESEKAKPDGPSGAGK